MDIGIGEGLDTEYAGRDSVGSGGSGRSMSAEHTVLHASYGKACMNCVRSKTRCASSPTGGRCERCHRLNKECQPAPTIRKKKTSRKSTLSANKTAALEEKLDGIVQMLQRSQAPQDEVLATLSSASTFTERANLPLDLVQNTNFDPLAFRAQIQMFGESAAKSHMNQVYNGPVNTDGQGGATCGNFFTRPAQWNQPKPLETTGQVGLPDKSSKTASRHMNQLDTLLKAAEEGARYCPMHPVPTTPATSNDSDTAGTCGPSTTLSNNTATTTPASTYNDYRPEDGAELQECLDTYRTQMFPFFPIVFVPSSMTIQELRSERPFLWLVIRAICSKSLARQSALGMEVRKKIGYEMLLEGTKSQDLFLGLLVFAAWGHFYICTKPIISTVIQLCISLAFDMGLTRPAAHEPMAMLNYSAQGCPKPPHLVSPPGRTMEDRRAAIGLFLVSSVAANYFQRIEPLRWSSYLEDCVQLLEETRDCPTDTLLVYLVRVQLIINQIPSVPWNETHCPTGNKTPQDLYDKILNSQLKHLERNIPAELQSNNILRLHILNATLSIHEHSLSTTTLPSSSRSLDSSVYLNRIKNIWTCYTATKSWFELYFSLSTFPISCYPHISMAVLTQMAHCLVALFRLSTFEHPDIPWDRQLVWQELDLGATVRLMSDRWEVVASTLYTSNSSSVGEQDAWSFTSKRLAGIGNWWELKVAAMKAAEAEKEGVQGVVAGEGEMEIQGQQAEAMDFTTLNPDFWDDIWMRDLVMGGNEFTMDSYL